MYMQKHFFEKLSDAVKFSKSIDKKNILSTRLAQINASIK